jgi:hypothetical protein
MYRPYDTSSWPCQTPDLFWALSDDLHNIGKRRFMDEDFVEYEIDVDELPDGRRALWKLNALRNINVCLPGFEDTAVKASLCIGSSTLQTIDLYSTTEFSMFTKDHILPLYILDEPLIVRIEFRGLKDTCEIPRKCIEAEGLLVRIKDKKMPFFVAASSESILTYDGFKTNVKSRISSELLALQQSDDEEKQTGRDIFEASDESEGEVSASRWNAVNNDDSKIDDLWRALKF